MSNDNQYERLFKLQATVGKLVLDGKRDPDIVADMLQSVIDHKSTGSQQRKKFRFFADLGTVIVPETYNASLSEHYLCALSHGKCRNLGYPTHKLSPGEKFSVRLYRQCVPGTTTAETRLNFLNSLNATLVGSHGLSLIALQKKDQLPSYKAFQSLDEEDHLAIGDLCQRMVPCLYMDCSADLVFVEDTYNSHFLHDQLLLAFHLER